MTIETNTRRVEIEEPSPSEMRKLLSMNSITYPKRYLAMFEAGARAMLETLEAKRGARREEELMNDGRP